MKKSKNAKRYKTAGVGLKTTISADGVKGFFARGKIIAKLVDRGKAIPRKRIINFDTPEEMLSVLTKERRKLMLLLRKGAFSISQITRLTHRDRSVITKDVKLLEYYGLVTVSEEVNPGHGHHKIVHAISKYPISLEATI
ncbi:MAG TPA: MarR family transcriptional regulator [Gammaproteobacteria bacterium]|nr:MarR family transcriptional regulator [Gammaproteobacteria bacterium]